MKRIKTYRVYWIDEHGEHNDFYIQALNATDAVDILNIPHDQVVEVSVVLENWKRSK